MSLSVSAPAQTKLAAVCADRRWPEGTGVGLVQFELELRKPSDVQIIDLKVKGSIGSPLSPLQISLAHIRQKCAKNVGFVSYGFVPPLFRIRRSVVIVHDLTHLHYYGWLKRLYYNIIMRSLYKKCENIACVSEFTKQEFLKWSGIDRKKVHVIYNGVSSEFNPTGDKLDFGYKYLLYPGNHRSYKNLDRLIRAYALSEAPTNNIHLVLTGAENSDLRAVAEAARISHMIHFTGKLPSRDIPSLYRGAHAVTFPSLYEGFGLPIVEAMASGIPVLTSSISCMPEIAADAALLVDPTSDRSMSDAISQICTDDKLRKNLIKNGLARAAVFNWDRSAELFWSLANRSPLR